MLINSLVNAVDSFAKVTQGISDEDLDRRWAWGAYDSEGIRFAFFRTYEELRELAVGLLAGRQSNRPVLSSAHRILAHYHAAYRDLGAALLGIGDDEAEQASAEGEWPIRRVVAHIAGADMGFYTAIKFALDRYRRGDAAAAEIPLATWEEYTGLDEASYEALMKGPLMPLRAYHEELHRLVLADFAGITDEELTIPSMFWEGYPLPLQFRLHRFDSHCRQHTIQIDKSLAGRGRPPTEAKRLLRLVYAALAEAEGATIGAWDAAAELQQSAAARIIDRAAEITATLANNDD